MSDWIIGGIGFLLGLLLLTAVMAFFTQPMIMKESAELFCSKDGQGLIDYKSEVWDFKYITCGGQARNVDVIERNYKPEQTKTYDIFEDD